MGFFKKIIKRIRGIDSEFSYNMYENGEFELIKKISKIKFKEIFDVGCHHGEWSLLIDKFIHDSKVHTFEISESNFKILEKKLYHDKFVNNNFGLSNVEGDFKYKDYGKDSQINTSIINSNYHDNSTKFNLKKTKMKIGDNYCKNKNINFIDFLKIDTEGSEHFVLKGFNQMIDKGKIRLIQFEYGYANGDAKFLMKDFFNFFSEKDYIVAKLRKKINFKEWDYSFNDFKSGPNYLAIKKDDIELKTLLEQNIN